MPVMDGHEVLAERKLDESNSEIPMVILSTSSDPRDVAKSYALGGNAYMVKPTGFDDFQTLLKSFYQYWCHTVLLPSGNCQNHRYVRMSSQTHSERLRRSESSTEWSVSTEFSGWVVPASTTDTS
eukprot:TRINITY_DN25477_c0_g1_i12.p1 TRINITY_DN25477_c0_g1~~TRINITY_DN25477_c0_g1_i12.p1  ORF type:complete len:146 (+),score=14.85 TRINITY_DN25477_c0_g1_i12:66-440(+)